MLSFSVWKSASDWSSRIRCRTTISAMSGITSHAIRSILSCASSSTRRAIRSTSSSDSPPAPPRAPRQDGLLGQPPSVASRGGSVAVSSSVREPRLPPPTLPPRPICGVTALGSLRVRSGPVFALGSSAARVRPGWLWRRRLGRPAPVDDGGRPLVADGHGAVGARTHRSSSGARAKGLRRPLSDSSTQAGRPASPRLAPRPRGRRTHRRRARTRCRSRAPSVGARRTLFRARPPPPPSRRSRSR